MLDAGLRSVALAQVERLRLAERVDSPELGALLARANSPDDVRQALLKERPVLDARRALRVVGPDPHDLREEALAASVLDASRADLLFRRLYPSMDLGIYCASHAIGKPSMAALPMADEARSHLVHHGLLAWERAWMATLQEWKRLIAMLCGGDLLRGDVAPFANCTDALSAVLAGLQGTMVTDAGQFTTCTYVQRRWAERGGTLVEVPLDQRDTVPTERLVAALTPDTTIVSISHANWRSGHVHDLELLAEGMARVCPDAALVLDAYQTVGTVPIDVGILPLCTAIVGGGIKQLRAGPGGGYAWVSHALLDRIEPDRTGWWAHEDPMSFDAGPMRYGDGAAKLFTGTPNPLSMSALVAEARVFAASADGDLKAAVRRARQVTHRQVLEAIKAAEELGFEVTGPSNPERRAAFFAVRVKGAELVQELAREGVTVDYRGDRPGVRSGVIRISANAAGFSYEPIYALERLAALVR